MFKKIVSLFCELVVYPNIKIVYDVNIISIT